MASDAAHSHSRTNTRGCLTYLGSSPNKDSLNRFYTLCTDEVKNSWMVDYEKLASCNDGKETGWGYYYKRIKRLVWFVFIAAIILITIVSAITITTVVVNDKVNLVNASLVDAKVKLEQVKVALKKQEEINTKTVKGMADMGRQTFDLVKSIGVYAFVMPNLVWSSTNKVNPPNMTPLF